MSGNRPDYCLARPPGSPPFDSGGLTLPAIMASAIVHPDPERRDSLITKQLAEYLYPNQVVFLTRKSQPHHDHGVERRECLAP